MEYYQTGAQFDIPWKGAGTSGLAFLILSILGMYMYFKKFTGIAPWKSIIPIYRHCLLYKSVDLPAIIPIVPFILAILNAFLITALSSAIRGGSKAIGIIIGVVNIAVALWLIYNFIKLCIGISTKLNKGTLGTILLIFFFPFALPIFAIITPPGNYEEYYDNDDYYNNNDSNYYDNY